MQFDWFLSLVMIVGSFVHQSHQLSHILVQHMILLVRVSKCSFFLSLPNMKYIFALKDVVLRSSPSSPSACCQDLLYLLQNSCQRRCESPTCSNHHPSHANHLELCSWNIIYENISILWIRKLFYLIAQSSSILKRLFNISIISSSVSCHMVAQA